MGCITSAKFVVLINGSPSRFFTPSRGIRQGCPLSPLLFILVIEGLSLLINDATRCGRIKGIKISASLTLTNLLFVDDVVMFGLGTFEEWVDFDVILETFCHASGMCISIDKSGFLFNEMDMGVLNNIRLFIPYCVKPLHEGFKYLGYFIKPK